MKKTSFHCKCEEDHLLIVEYLKVQISMQKNGSGNHIILNVPYNGALYIIIYYIHKSCHYLDIFLN